MDDWLILMLCGFGAYALFAWVLSPAARLKRELKATPRISLRDLPEATRARVVGVAQPLDATLEAPLTGRPCLYYVVTVEQGHGGESSGWKQILREERGVPFLLDDRTGRAIVDPQAAKVALVVDGRGNSSTFDDPNERESAFLARHGTSAQGWLLNKRLRYREAIIAIGETVAIVGEGVREPDPAGAPTGGYRGDAPTRVRMTSSARYPLLISDSPETTS